MPILFSNETVSIEIETYIKIAINMNSSSYCIVCCVLTKFDTKIGVNRELVNLLMFSQELNSSVMIEPFVWCLVALNSISHRQRVEQQQ